MITCYSKILKFFFYFSNTLSITSCCAPTRYTDFPSLSAFFRISLTTSIPAIFSCTGFLTSLDAKTVFIGSAGRQGFMAAIIGNTCEEIVDDVDADLFVLNRNTVKKG